MNTQRSDRVANALSLFDKRFLCQGANMVRKTRKTLGFKKIMSYKIPPRVREGKPYLATGLTV